MHAYGTELSHCRECLGLVALPSSLDDVYGLKWKTNEIMEFKGACQSRIFRTSFNIQIEARVLWLGIDKGEQGMLMAK